MTNLSASASSASDSLAPRDIHLWLCERSHTPDSETFVRRVLSRYAPVPPSHWQFNRSEHGKPFLAETAHALDFNLSHSGDWLACAVTAGSPIGVDIEQCKPRHNAMTLARRFFCAEEVAALENCGGKQGDRFYDLWTLKEAAVKARGQVLVSGLDTRSFALTYARHTEDACADIAVTTTDEMDTAHYGLLQPVPDYRLALCWLPAIRCTPHLQVFEWREGGSSAPCPLSLRGSTW